MSNSVDPDEMAHYEPSHLDLRCLQKPIVITYGSERVHVCYSYNHKVLNSFLHCILQMFRNLILQ